ncbi:MAG: dTDP-4-dehydrorhamnose 3,5-epimerase family protein [Bacteroides intestinalis]|nr:dTDP-4-dehydrorhamnose 3,5-epimerase family protein [Bacteroides intestinalis]
MIEGVKLYSLKHIVVPKGDVYHALKSTDEGYVGFGEAYFSQIEAGAVKGWKRHNQMTLNIIVPIGAIKFVIYDDREGSATYGKFEEVVLSAVDNYQRLLVFPGLWMDFQGVGEGVSMLMDIIPEPHDPQEASRKELSEIIYHF